jgi:two-component system chemotaxis response regulator CheB
MRFSGVDRRDIVVIGASTGGIEALTKVVKSLPENFPGSIFVVMHIGPISLLPQILTRSTRLRTVSAQDGMRFEPGCIYVAPPNRHLLITDSEIKLSAGPRENGHRPAVDPLFRSASREHRSRVAGVILSGTLDDGAAGLFAVKSRNGVAIVQDPEDAFAADMPRNAMRNLSPDYVLPAEEISQVLLRLAQGEAGARQPREEKMSMESETEMPLQDPPPAEEHIALACPECSGPLYEKKDGPVTRFQCNVRHSYSPLSLSAAHDEALERALWVAVRTLNERITLHRQMLRRERNEGEEVLFHRMEDSVKMAEQDVTLLRQIIERI